MAKKPLAQRQLMYAVIIRRTNQYADYWDRQNWVTRELGGHYPERKVYWFLEMVTYFTPPNFLSGRYFPEVEFPKRFEAGQYKGRYPEMEKRRQAKVEAGWVSPVDPEWVEVYKHPKVHWGITKEGRNVFTD